MKYTYRLLKVPADVVGLTDHKQIEEQLNNAGEEGYRFVGKKVDYKGFVAIMEKEVHG